MTNLRCILATTLLLPTIATELSHVTSSVFSMDLLPTTAELEISSTTALVHAIESTIAESASQTSSFEALMDLTIVLQLAQWNRNELSTTIQFDVHATFTTGPAAKSTAPPSEFALDSLVARTFSQPTSKRSFIDRLVISQEIGLVGVVDISVSLVNMTEIQSSSTARSPETLSRLDIALISVSLSVLVGILSGFCVHHWSKSEIDSRQLYTYHSPRGKGRERRKGKTDGDKNPEEPPPLGECDSSPILVPNDSSTDAGIESPGGSQIVTGATHYAGSPVRYHTNDPSHGVPQEANFSHWSSSANAAPSTPTGFSNSSSSSASSPCSDSILSPPGSNGRGTPYLLGAPAPNYSEDSFSTDSQLSPLTARLLRLPAMTSIDSAGSPSRHSAASAPGILMRSTLSPQTSDCSGVESDSVRSARSASGVLMSPCHVSKQEAMARRSSSNLTDLAVIAEQSVFMSTSGDFESSWGKARELALDADEASSTEDVFCVDVEHQSTVEDSQSRTSGPLTVSEWMKSVHVIGGSCDTRTSDMTHSSVEHSSVEPKSGNYSTGSTDQSLEGSLAKSAVEV